MRNPSIIIPAAGLGKRIADMGPKPLIDLKGEAVIGRQIRILRDCYPRSEVIAVLGHECDRVAATLPRWVRIVENERHAQTNVARSLGLGLGVATRDEVLVVYGDLVFNAEAVEWPRRAGSALVAAPMDADEIGINDDVSRLDYGLPRKWAQIAFYAKRELNLLRELARNRANEMKFGFELINEILEAGGRFKILTSPETKVVEIDLVRDIAKARKLCAS